MLWIFKIFKKSNFFRDIFLKIRSSKNIPWNHSRSHKKLGPISSAVLTYIGYTNKQTEDKQTDRQGNYIKKV